MKTIKVQSDEHNIHIDCPECDMWEQLGGGWTTPERG